MASSARWDLTALLNAADARAPATEQNLWLVRLPQWLRMPGPATDGTAPDRPDTPATPWPVRRLRLLLGDNPQEPDAVRLAAQIVSRSSSLAYIGPAGECAPTSR